MSVKDASSISKHIVETNLQDATEIAVNTLEPTTIESTTESSTEKALDGPATQSCETSSTLSTLCVSASPSASTLVVEDSETKDLLGMFIALLRKFLKSLSITFSDCTAVPLYKSKFELAVTLGQQEELIKKWHSDLQAYYRAIDDKNEYKLMELAGKPGPFRELKIKQKWENPRFTSKNKDLVWAYMKKLCNFSRLHCQVPSNMMDRILKVAHRLKGQSENGLDLASLDLASIGREVVEGLAQSDTDEFSRNIPSIFEAISKMGDIDPKMLANAMSGSSGVK